MAAKSLISLVGGGLRPPSSVNTRFLTSDSNITDWSDNIAHGLLKTAIVSASVLTEVINITGSGVVTIMGMVHDGFGSVTDPKLKIVVDGVTVVDETSADALSSLGHQFWAAVGALWAEGSPTNAFDVEYGNLIFNESLVVSIGTEGTSSSVSLLWDRYLT